MTLIGFSALTESEIDQVVFESEQITETMYLVPMDTPALRRTFAKSPPFVDYV